MRPLFLFAPGLALVALSASPSCGGIGEEPDERPDDTSADDTGGAFDEDGDGYTVAGGDCAESDPAINPGAEEICDGEDNDCDDMIDENGTTLWYLDTDGDGFGAADSAVAACEAPGEAWVTVSGDCNDEASSVHPDAVEGVGDGVDSNCNGEDDT